MGFKKEIFFILKNNRDKIFIYFIFLLLGYFIYKPAFSSYFFQDDWFTFRISQISSFKDFLQFFLPRTDVIYFRPLGMQVYFYLMKLLFGINPVFFRLSALIIYAMNGILVYIFLLKLKLSRIASLLGSSLFVSSVVSYIPFFWSSTFPFILGVTFFLISFLFYSSIKKNRQRNLVISLLFYILSLLTLEIIIVLPILLFIWEILYNKVKTLKRIFIYIIPLFGYLYLRLVAFSVSLKGSYSLKINLLPTVRNYLLWCFNWPEEISRQVVSIFSINPVFFASFTSSINILFIQSLIIVLILLVVPLYLKIRIWFIRRSSPFELNEFFGILWFLVTLLPLLIFSDHTFPYYLPIPLIGILLFLVSQTKFIFNYFRFNKLTKIIFTIVILIVWIGGSSTTVKFNQHAHWAPMRGLISRKTVDKVSKSIGINQNTIVEFKASHSEWEMSVFKLSLNDQDAFKFLFGDQVMTVYGKFPNNINLEKYKIITL